MALYTELQIYEPAQKLFRLMPRYVVNIPRPFGRSMGEYVLQVSAKVVMLIFRANCARNKVEHLQDLRERVEELNLFLRLFCDEGFISPKQHGAAMELTTSIGKQATKWKKSCATSPAP